MKILKKQSQKILKKDILLPLLLFLLTFLIRLPLYHTDFWRTPDAVEYINVANRIDANEGLTQSIKWHYFDSNPVVTSALHGKPIFAPVIFSFILRLNNNVYNLQLFTFLIMSFVCVLAYFIARKFFSPLLSFFLSVFIIINPNLLITNRLILSEPLFYLFVLSAFLLFYSNKEKGNVYKVIFIGIFSALAYLTRNEGAFLLVIFALFYIKQPKYLLILFLSFFLVSSPFLYLNYQVNGNPFYSYNINHFRVKSFSEGMGNGYLTNFPTSNSFISSHLSWIANAIMKMFIGNIKSLISLQFFSFLSLAFLMLKWKNIRQFLPFILFAVVILVNYSIFWAAFSDPENHFSIIFILLLFPLFSVLVSHKDIRKYIFIFLAVLSLVIYIPYDIHRIQWARTTEKISDTWSKESKLGTYNWITQNTNTNDIIASENPWLVYLNTQRPSILYPTNISNRKNLTMFLKQYNVKYVLVDQNFSNTFDLLKSVYKNNGMQILKRISTTK